MTWRRGGAGRRGLPCIPASPCPGDSGGGAAPATLPPSACRLQRAAAGGGAAARQIQHSKGLDLWFRPPRPSWPLVDDGHVRLFAALRPLQLRTLMLFDCVLGVADVAALVEQLPELEVG